MGDVRKVFDLIAADDSVSTGIPPSDVDVPETGIYIFRFVSESSLQVELLGKHTRV